MTTRVRNKLIEATVWTITVASFLLLAHCAHRGVILRSGESTIEACQQYAREIGSVELERECASARTSAEVISAIDKIGQIRGAKAAKLRMAAECPIVAEPPDASVVVRSETH